MKAQWNQLSTESKNILSIVILSWVTLILMTVFMVTNNPSASKKNATPADTIRVTWTPSDIKVVIKTPATKSHTTSILAPKPDQIAAVNATPADSKRLSGTMFPNALADLGNSWTPPAEKPLDRADIMRRLKALRLGYAKVANEVINVQVAYIRHGEVPPQEWADLTNQALNGEVTALAAAVKLVKPASVGTHYASN